MDLVMLPIYLYSDDFTSLTTFIQLMNKSVCVCWITLNAREIALIFEKL